MTINENQLNSVRLNDGEELISNFNTEMRRKRGSKPVFKIEFIEIDDTVTDITQYYIEGANFEKIKERAPDEIQAGNFDILLSNQDDNFSEFVSGSFLEGKQYIGASIKVSVGFILPDGTTEFESQIIGIIDELKTGDNESHVVFRCRDRISKIIDKKLRPIPTVEIPVYAANRGNGVISTIESLAFATTAQSWTVTCTTGGGNGVAQFSVTGSVSGSIGPATSGTEFSDTSVGIKFTITAGTDNWAVGDEITFSQAAVPQWNIVNPAKIIWSVLTGFNFDSDTQESWSSSVLSLDSTQSTSNTDINYNSFLDAITDLGGVIEGFGLKGFISYGETGKNLLESILIIFLGSIYTDADGKIVLRTWTPQFGDPDVTVFSDTKKIAALGYIKSIDQVLNSAIIHFKRDDSWEFSGTDLIFDAVHSLTDATSITKYGQFDIEISSKWYTANGQHVENFAQRIIGKFADPPLNIDFETGLDALKTEIGDIISVTDSKYGFSDLLGEVVKIRKSFDKDPKSINIRFRRDDDPGIQWGFLGSSVVEGDGLSPQSSTFAGASDSDKRFAYHDINTVGGIDYRMF